MADEEAIRSETLDRCDGATEFVGQRTNDRNTGKVGPEFDGDREDQARLNQRVEWTEKVGEFQAGDGVREWRDWSLHSVARKIDPFQKVSNLVAANAKRDREYFGSVTF